MTARPRGPLRRGGSRELSRDLCWCRRSGDHVRDAAMLIAPLAAGPTWRIDDAMVPRYAADGGGAGLVRPARRVSGASALGRRRWRAGPRCGADHAAGPARGLVLIADFEGHRRPGARGGRRPLRPAGLPPTTAWRARRGSASGRWSSGFRAPSRADLARRPAAGASRRCAAGGRSAVPMRLLVPQAHAGEINSQRLERLHASAQRPCRWQRPSRAGSRAEQRGPRVADRLAAGRPRSGSAGVQALDRERPAVGRAGAACRFASSAPGRRAVPLC